MFLEFSSNLSVKIWKTFYLEVFATGEDLNGRPEALHLSSAHTCGESPAWGCFFCPWPQLKAHFFFRIKPQSSVPTDTHTPKRNVYQSTFSILANFFFFQGNPRCTFYSESWFLVGKFLLPVLRSAQQNSRAPWLGAGGELDHLFH